LHSIADEARRTWIEYGRRWNAVATLVSTAIASLDLAAGVLVVAGWLDIATGVVTLLEL